MLSDVHLRNPNSNKRSTGNYRMECTFKTGHLEFCKWVKLDLLASVSTSHQPTPYPRENPTQHWNELSALDYFTELHAIWYVPKAIKGATKVLLSLTYLNNYNYFTEVSLAHIIMGDGYWENDSKTVLICTENYSLVEVQTFIAFLEARFGLKATTKKRKANYRIRFSSANNNLKTLKTLVIPYMHPSMLWPQVRH